MNTGWKMLGLACMAIVAAFLSGAAGAAGQPEQDAAPAAPGRSAMLLKQLPANAGAYLPEAAALVMEGVPAKYGTEEWTAVVLTNELHQHLGIYNMLGAKMGVRARELLNAPTRSVDVTAETGAAPPMSCMLDGLQAALGSTLGQNLIHAAATDTPKAAAVFAYQGKKLRLSLKPEMQKRVAELIGKAIRDCGNLTPAYFERIEELSFRVWADSDRNDIFVEEWL
jgi:pyrimidine-specific ribonucleoside hydrolase